MSTHDIMPFERSHAPTIEELNELFESYDFKSLIAVGGMGAVYLAEQNSLERSVAIKILPRRYSRSEEFFQAFENEAKTVARLNHQNLVSIHDFGVVGELPFLVMEYVFGQSLDNFISNELIGYKYAARLILSLCRGVKHAHQKNVVHRDIKPANLILTSDGYIKLVDFGIAKQCGYISFKTGDTIFGTAGFAAPEMSHSPQLIDARSDIYAIGATLCQLVTGYTPDTLITKAIEKRHLLGPLYPVVFKAIRTAPEKRYQDIDELVDAIYDAISQEHVVVKNKEQESLVIQRNQDTLPVYTAASKKESSEEQIKILLSGTAGAHDVVLADRYHLNECLRQELRMVVYKATDTQMKREVKVRLLFKAYDATWTTSFFKVLKDLSRVEHPNITKVLDAGLFDAGAYIVYGWVERQKLKHWMNEDLSYENYYTFALQMLDALEVASHYGFHHYAMNTYSVISADRSVMSDRRYLLTDVGVSEVLSLIYDDVKSLPGVRKEWAAPELILGVPVGERTSIFIFAQFLLTLVFRGHPLSGLNLDEIKKKYAEDFRINIWDYRDDLPEEFVEWMAKLAEPDVGKRFKSIREARKALPKRPKAVRI